MVGFGTPLGLVVCPRASGPCRPQGILPRPTIDCWMVLATWTAQFQVARTDSLTLRCIERTEAATPSRTALNPAVTSLQAVLSGRMNAVRALRICSASQSRAALIGSVNQRQSVRSLPLRAAAAI